MGLLGSRGLQVSHLVAPNHLTASAHSSQTPQPSRKHPPSCGFRSPKGICVTQSSKLKQALSEPMRICVGSDLERPEKRAPFSGNWSSWWMKAWRGLTPGQSLPDTHKMGTNSHFHHLSSWTQLCLCSTATPGQPTPCFIL